MEHGDPRGEAVFFHGVEKAVVEIDALLVHGAVAVGVDAGPGEGETVVLRAEGAHEFEVGVVAGVVFAGGVEVVGVFDRAGLAGEAVLDGLAFAVGEGGALDLRAAAAKPQTKFLGKESGRDLIMVLIYKRRWLRRVGLGSSRVGLVLNYG